MQDLKIYKNKTFKKKILEILSNKKFIKKKYFLVGSVTHHSYIM